MDGHLFDPDLLQWKVFPADWGCYLRCSNPKEISGFDATERRFATKFSNSLNGDSLLFNPCIKKSLLSLNSLTIKSETHVDNLIFLCYLNSMLKSKFLV
jgi:hypothetical protein